MKNYRSIDILVDKITEFFVLDLSGGPNEELKKELRRSAATYATETYVYEMAPTCDLDDFKRYLSERYLERILLKTVLEYQLEDTAPIFLEIPDKEEIKTRVAAEHNNERKPKRFSEYESSFC